MKGANQVSLPPHRPIGIVETLLPEADSKWPAGVIAAWRTPLVFKPVNTIGEAFRD